MSSLLATLLELRIFIITIFLSGAVHLTLIGGGWLDLDESPKLGGQSLAITVSASRADLSKAESVISQEIASESLKPDAALSSLSFPSSGSNLSKPVVSKQVISKPIAEPVSVPVEHKRKESSIKVPVSRLPEQRTDPVRKEVVATVALSSNTESVPAVPVYQSNPEFRHPPKPPKYPRLARKRGIEGQVVLRADIDQAGSVFGLDIEQSSGSDLLDRAARKAVQQWQFVPAETNGIAVVSYVRIPVDFVLESR